MIIIGNGMLAKAFSKLNNKLPDCVVFASGVSNSKCEDPLEFNREFNLLKNALKYNKRLIYFSTCSIYDSSLNLSPYIDHKLKIENFITVNFKDYIIYRLPNLIGITKNKNTLINCFIESILKGTTLNLYKDSTRYIIDVDDVVNYVYLTKSISNSIINLNFNINYKVLDIWQEVENVLGKKGKSRIIEAGYDYKVDNSLFISKLRGIEIPELNDKDYFRKTINKYINQLK